MKRSSWLVIGITVVAIIGVVYVVSGHMSSSKQAATPTPAPGEQIVLEGKLVCLPHKDTSGPQTMECATGLETADQKYYGLVRMPAAAPVQTGARVRVTGALASPSAEGIYDVAGDITVASVTQL